MRKALFCLTIATGFAAWCFFAVGVANADPYKSNADPYKWCAQYGGEEGGGTNCGFITIEQCRATISGMGGFCVPNPFYTGPDQTPAKHSRKRTLRGPA